MTSSEPSPTEKMKATLYCLVLSEIPGKKQVLHCYLTNTLQKQPSNAKIIFDLCCQFLAADDPEFADLEEVLCGVLRLVGQSVDTSGQLASFLANESVSDAVLKNAIREKAPRTAIMLRETIARDTLALLKVEEFWAVSKFHPLMKNVGQFICLEDTFVCTVFEILLSFKFTPSNCRDVNERAVKLMELCKIWLHQLHPRIVERKKLILNQLYERILAKRSSAVMSSILTLVEVEILNALLNPIPIETVASVTSELISWARIWPFNCSLLLPPIIKLLSRLAAEGFEDDYNKIALENCDKMLHLVQMSMYRPLISIICHFYKTSTSPQEIILQTSENLKLVIINSSKNESDKAVMSNLIKALELVYQNYPDCSDLVIRLVRECSEQTSDTITNFTVNESPKGIVNTGNTCYANSVLQCLFYSTEFRNKVLQQKPKGSQTLLSNIQQIFALLKFSSSPVIFPDESFHAAVRPSYFVRGQQEDSFLYLIHILDMMKEQELKVLGLKDDEMDVKKESCATTVPNIKTESNVSGAPCEFLSDEEIKKELNANFSEMPDESDLCASGLVIKSEGVEFSSNPETTNNNIPDDSETDAAEEAALAYHTLSQQIFGGYQVETYFCHGCRFKYKQTKRTTAISLSIPDRESCKSRISELLESYFKPVELQDSERYECRSCKAKVDSTCYTELVTAPKCLILCLKRFFYDKGLQRTLKITNDVQIDEEILVKGSEFKIYATVVHSGSSASHGHYYAMVNTENGLMKLDDSSVVSNAHSLGQLDTPYILFYQRKDCRMDEQDVSFEQLDAGLRGYVKSYRGRGFGGLSSNVFKKQQPPPPPPPSSSCGGPDLSSNRVVF